MKRIWNKRGQSMVEFAVILPLLLMVLLGIMEFGLLLSNQLILESASREAARAAVLGSSDSQLQTYINELTDTLDQSRLAVAITPSASARIKGVPVTVTLRFEHRFLAAAVLNLSGTTMELQSSTTMRME